MIYLSAPYYTKFNFKMTSILIKIISKVIIHFYALFLLIWDKLFLGKIPFARLLLPEIDQDQTNLPIIIY